MAHKQARYTVNEEASQKKIDKIKKQQAKASQEKNPEKVSLVRRRIKQDVDYTMDGSVKQLFLNLTKMEVPFGQEKTLEEFMPPGIKKDAHGNFYIKIGETKTIFCCHLDTYSYERKRVWHVIRDNKIYTDGTTVLGGDDKAGMVIMLKMIEAGVPGLYYFFRGEEGVLSPTGTWGSKQALQSYKENFKKYEKCIAFDRKGIDNIITEQMYTECCSTEFATELIDGLNKFGFKYFNDPTGMWCDSGVFMETIPECTNISVGFYNEHTFSEYQDMAHLEKLVETCIKIDWEKLPTKRDPSVVTKSIGRYNYDYDYSWYNQRSSSKYYHSNNVYQTKRDYATLSDLFWHIEDIFGEIGYNPISDNYAEGEAYCFQHYETRDTVCVRVFKQMGSLGETIFMSNERDDFVYYEYIGGIKELEDLIDSFDYIDAQEIEDKVEAAFVQFTYDNPDIASDVLLGVKYDGDVDFNTYFNLENAFRKLRKEMSLGDYGIDEDTYIEWARENADLMSDIIGEVTTEGKKKTPEEIFFDVAVNDYPGTTVNFVHNSIDKGFVDDEKNYDMYKKVIDPMLKSKYSKELNNNNEEVNHRKFIEWLKANKDDVMRAIDKK